MKERFEPSEWERLLRLPVHLFHAVSLADREMQEEEVVEFATAVSIASQYKDPLQSELLMDLGKGENFARVRADALEIASDGRIMQDYLAVKRLLEDRLKTEEYHRFLVSLAKFGMKVAQAAGEGSTRFSSDEQAALAFFIDTFGVDLDAGAAALDG